MFHTQFLFHQTNIIMLRSQKNNCLTFFPDISDLPPHTHTHADTMCNAAKRERDFFLISRFTGLEHHF